MLLQKGVAILIATYNGDEYLTAQLNSILNQSYKNITCYIHDDGSTDNTLKIIEEFIKKFPNKFKLLRYENRKHNAKYNFISLMEYALDYTDEDYIMFSDQDDIWLENKVEIEIKNIVKEETKNNGGVLVFADQVVVDSHLNEIYPSATRLINMKTEDYNFKKLVFRNVAAGCSICINRKMLELSMENMSVDDVIMHDWWIMLVASCCGKIKYIDTCLMLYRQHEMNVLGVDNNHYCKKIKKYISSPLKSLNDRTNQMKYCLRQVHYLNKYICNKERKQSMELESKMNEFYKIRRIMYLYKNKYITKNNFFTYFFV